MAEKRSYRVFSVDVFRFAVSTGTTGKWDRFTSTGTKIKDGLESVFDEKTLGQIVDNFAARKNDLPMCFDHQSVYVEANGQPAPALAWYNALALVIGGEVVKFATHDPAVNPPVAAGMADGVYGYRNELTPLGEKLLPNYRYLSPLFTTEGADEQGNPIGYELLDVAATNTPFQDGVGMAFHLFSGIEESRVESRMDKALMAKYGLTEGYSSADLESAMKKFADDASASGEESKKKLEELEGKLKKFDDASGDDKDGTQAFDVDPENLPQNAAVHLKTGNVHDEDGRAQSKMSRERQHLAEIAKKIGLSEKATAAEIMSAVNATMVPITRVEEMVSKRVDQRFAAEKKERDRMDAIDRAEKLALSAVQGGYDPADKKALVEFATTNYAAAERSVSHFLRSASQLYGRTMAAGIDRPAAQSDVQVRQMGGVRIMKHGMSLSAEAKAMAKKDKISYEAALDRIVKEKPELYQAYLSQLS